MIHKYKDEDGEWTGATWEDYREMLKPLVVIALLVGTGYLIWRFG